MARAQYLAENADTIITEDGNALVLELSTVDLGDVLGPASLGTWNERTDLGVFDERSTWRERTERQTLGSWEE